MKKEQALDKILLQEIPDPFRKGKETQYSPNMKLPHQILISIWLSRWERNLKGNFGYGSKTIETWGQKFG